MFRHFFRVILPILPAALVIGFFFRQTKTLVFIRDFGQATSMSISDVFGMLFSTDIVYYVLLVPIFFVVLSFSCSYLLTMVYKHFRMGKLSVKMPLSNVNHGLQSVIPCLATIFLILILYKLLFACLVSFISEVILRAGAPNGGTIAMIAILGIASYVFVVFFLMYPILAGSLMLVYGYTFKDAISEALHVSGKKDFFSFLFAYMFPFIVNVTLSYILMAFNTPLPVLVIVNILIDLFVLTYLVLLSLISVFTQQKLERIDLKKLY